MSEAQAGKSVCDRMAAIVKNKLRSYVNNNHDVIDANQFLQGLKEGESLQGFSVYVASIPEDQDIITKAPKTFIPGITTYSEFVFEENMLRVFQFAEIGDGLTFHFNQLKSFENQAEIRTLDFWQYIYPDDNEDIISLPSERRRYWYENKKLRYWMTYEKKTVPLKSSCQREIFEEGEFTQEDPKFYTCPEDLCPRSFESQQELEEHIDSGNHYYEPQRVTLRDRVLNMYSRGLEGFNDLKTMPFITEAVNTYFYEHPIENPSEGFAHYKRKACKKFSQPVTSFLKELFEQGKASNKKLSPRSAAESMRNALNVNGNLLFTPDELLTENQIKSYFSRLAALSRQNSDYDPIKSRKRKVIEAIPESQLCEEDEMINFEDEPSLENDISFFMDTIQAELSEETQVCSETMYSHTRRYLQSFLKPHFHQEL
uniref:C2H2-type domain-containing protein n=1 Tax=Acrobeloides nanus TaxID=290746 RepID=A0A914DXN5_9BILA